MPWSVPACAHSLVRGRTTSWSPEMGRCRCGASLVPRGSSRYRSASESSFGGQTIADTTAALRVCETSSPPAYYIPPADITAGCLEPSERTSFCEWKGVASYWTVLAGSRRAKDAAWSYHAPDPGYEVIMDYVAFYPRRMDACWVGEDRVEPQPGLYYGGWITPELVGPFKGAPGSEAW